MKRTRISSLLIVVFCLISMVFAAFAAETRASDQISSYRMNAVVRNGSIIVEFSVRGNGRMEKLGCQSIYIYEKNGNSWSFVESILEDDDGMSKTNSSSHTNTIYCGYEAGTEYKVVVTVFAENSAGRDARTKTFYVP